MDPDPLSIAILMSAFALIAIAAGAELGLANLNRSQLRQLSETGDQRATSLETMLADSSQVLIAFLLLKTLGFVMAGIALTRVWRTPDSVVASLGLLFGLWLMLAVTQVGVRAWVQPRASRVALRSAPFLVGATRLLRPFSLLLQGVARWLGEEDPQLPDESVFLSEDGLRLLMNVREEEDTIEPSERQMIESIFDLEDTVAREVMVPRIDMVALSVDTTLQDALSVINEAGHSRIPVYEENIDHIVGFLYAKDLLQCFQENQGDRPIRELLRAAHFVPVTKRLNVLFGEMQKQRVHIAVVVDEYGGTAGLISIEDILEEIVGDIQDEYDPEEDEYVKSIAAHTYLLNARLDVDTLAELLTLDLPDDNADTLGGLVYSLLGHVPEQGESISYAGWLFTVIDLDGRRVEQVRVEQVVPPAPIVNETVDNNQTSPSRSLPKFLTLY